MKAFLRLFKALFVDPSVRNFDMSFINKIIMFTEKTLPYGFVYSDTVLNYYSVDELEKMIPVINKELSLSAEQMNKSFHKSWAKIKEADLEQLVAEQLIHYFTTYGLESLGIDSSSFVYIPKEKLEIPELQIDELKLFVINGYSRSATKEKILKMLSSGIALHENTLNDVTEICEYLKLEFYPNEIDSIKNKEFKITLCDKTGSFPSNNVEFLRYLVYKSIGKTLLIKNESTIEMIKQSDNAEVLDLLSRYSLPKLSEIFYRFKPIFLAFRTSPQLKIIINRLRKLANKHHKPMKQDYMNSVTTMLRNSSLDFNKFEKELCNINVFRKIRLLYALNYQSLNPDSILYRIRNGKSYAKEFVSTIRDLGSAEYAKTLIKESISNDIRKNVIDKKIYIPYYINYTLPSSEKQFTGNFPSGTYVNIDKDMIFGIYWENIEVVDREIYCSETKKKTWYNEYRIDLDLALLDEESKIGWNGLYRTDEILFSGDMTDAEDGASELFYVANATNKNYIMTVNYYNFNADVAVPFKVMVGTKDDKQFEKNYMINPNNVVAVANTEINQRQKVLGITQVYDNACRFYFAESILGKSIASGNTDYVNHARKYLISFYKNAPLLNDILLSAGAILTDKNECDIDLSPEAIEKDTIINLLAGGE